MKKILFSTMGIFFACNTSQKTVTEEPKSKKEIDVSTIATSITEDELKEHLYVYASDEYEGRETGQPGQKKAVEYIKKEYEKLGIPAAKKDGDYFQNVPLKLNNVPSGKIVFNNKDYNVGEHVLTFNAANLNFSSITYVGFGIEVDNYSDYIDIDVKDKIILLKSGEPMDDDNNYIISGSKEKSIWSNASEAIGKKIKIALDKGAKGVLYYDSLSYNRFKSRFNFMKENNSGRMEVIDKTKKQFSSLFIDSFLAKNIYPEIESNNVSKVLESPLSIQVASTDDTLNSENVVAILKGSEKPEEYIVISSHLDHIGITPKGEINNGADDDGSGTVALLEIAEAFKKAEKLGQGPKRSIVFLHVTGEEKGLLGSQYYTDFDPIFPLENTVANLNVDMIGRIDPKREGNRNYIYLIGSDKLSTDLHNLSEEVNKKNTNIELDYTYNDENDPNRFYYRSDHYNFAKNNIPIIFYFNGTHDDYHRPTDTPDKINYDLLENRTRLIFYTAWEIANREKRLVVDNTTK
ncbi:M28 family metallopeptidase [uncultured Maribacter sp.]|uniref:M28 family metallopeptidase n=1 Tax=uncultured Maribacter sp. TaxID=431308 RepID=UPI00260A66AE|nr:M28 family metallopeptidase [uncultured Maribacter sp.]